MKSPSSEESPGRGLIATTALLVTNASLLSREWRVAIGAAVAAANARYAAPPPGSIRKISAISDRRSSWCSRLNSSQPVIHSGSPMPCRARRRKASRSAPHDCPSVAIRNSWSDRPRMSSLGHSLTIRRKTAAFNESSRDPRTSRTCGANRGPIVTRNSQAGFATGHDSCRIHFNKSRRIGCTAGYPCAVIVSIRVEPNEMHRCNHSLSVGDDDGARVSNCNQRPRHRQNACAGIAAACESDAIR